MFRWQFLKIFVSIVIIGVGLSGCVTIDNREMLNHPAMQFDQSWEPVAPSLMSGLNDLEGLSGGGGCSTCAH